MLTRLFAHFSGLLTRRRANAEAGDELAFHVEHETKANIARGMSPADARRRALADLGGVTQTTESVRDVRMTWLDAIWRDVRYAVRTLRRTPAFTLSALATLALVIGANSAVFSLADAILLRPLPYPQPERLAQVAWLAPSGGLTAAVDGRTWEAIRDETTAIDVAVLSNGRQRVNFNTSDAAAFVVQARVGAGYFRVLGTAPFIGREFTADEDRPAGAPVAVLSHDFWERVFQADPSAVGQTMFLRGEAYQIVGVTPRDFTPTGGAVDVFTPLRPSHRGEGGGSNYSVIARLHDGRTWPEAEGELTNVGQKLLKELLPAGQAPAGVTRRLSAQPLQDALTTSMRTPIHLLAGAGAVVLLIACVNIAALVLARGHSRKKELATRLALGSSRAAVVRQLVIESLVLGVAGGALGVVVAYVSLAALQAVGGDTFSSWMHATIDARAIAVTSVIAVFTALVFGLIPALSASRVDVSAAITEGGSRAVAGGARHWGRRVLIAAEVALSVVLLVVTGLFVRTLVNLNDLEPGFDARNVTSTSISLQDARYASADAVNQLFDVGLSELERTPGVESAAVSLGLPYGQLVNYPFRFEDRPDEENLILSNIMYVTPGFFDTLRIPLRAGRGFTATDRAGQTPVVVVNDAFVRFLTDGDNPIGRRLRLIDDTEWQIVGVVGDVQTRASGVRPPGMTRGPIVTPPIMFLPAAQISDSFAQIVHQIFPSSWTVRTSGSINAERSLQHAISQANALLPMAPATPLDDAQVAATSYQRLMLTLIGAFAVVALLLALVGIYGLIAQTVLERTREFGVRLALGATAGGTVWRVTVSGVVLAGAGVAAGLAMAWGATRLVESLLWGVERHDPLTFSAIAALLLVAAAIASLVPALRIVRIDPAKILRG